MPPEIAQSVGTFLDSLPRDALVVELGSGRCLFAGDHPNLVLSDYSIHALRRFGRGERLQLDAQALPFRDESVDAFFSIATIEHVPRPELVMAEIDRCLAHGGAALLYPAWFVFPWASRDLAHRPYRELGLRDRLEKALIPLRSHRVHRFLTALPRRLARELQLALNRQVPFTYRRLAPNLAQYQTSDSDAFTSMDPHACATFFLSRGCDVPGAATRAQRLLLRYVPIEVRKPKIASHQRARTDATASRPRR